jgi:FMN-dependent NADH-azoreductase
MKILHIDSSIFGDNSVSRELTAAIVDTLRAKKANATVTSRNVAHEEIPHLSGEIVSAGFIPETDWNETQRKERARTDELIEEFLAADVVVIGAPMYNFSIPSQLKAWIDRIAAAGRTFKYTETGPQGLAGGKKVFIASSRGGVYSTEQAQLMDFQEDYLKTVMGFVGISDVNFVRAEAVNMGQDKRETAIYAAKQAISQLAI